MSVCSINITMIVREGNLDRTCFTNSTKCSEYPLATSKQIYWTSGMDEITPSSLSRSPLFNPALTATC